MKQYELWIKDPKLADGKEIRLFVNQFKHKVVAEIKSRVPEWNKILGHDVKPFLFIKRRDYTKAELNAHLQKVLKGGK